MSLWLCTVCRTLTGPTNAPCPKCGGAVEYATLANPAPPPAERADAAFLDAIDEALNHPDLTADQRLAEIGGHLDAARVGATAGERLARQQAEHDAEMDLLRWCYELLGVTSTTDDPLTFARKALREARTRLATAPCADCAPAASPLSAPFTSPAFWTCPVCGSGAAERVESCEGFVDIADPEEGETEDVDARHPIVYRPEYVERLRAECARRDADLIAARKARDTLVAKADELLAETILLRAECARLREAEKPLWIILGLTVTRCDPPQTQSDHILAKIADVIHEHFAIAWTSAIGRRAPTRPQGST